MIGKIVSHYKILEEIGSGGMGIVYKAEDTDLKRLVALKFLPPELTRDKEAKERLIREAQSASALDHPNICTIHEIGKTDDGQVFISMGYYEGDTLKDKISHGPLDVQQVIDISHQIAKGLMKAHEKGFIHRDIKPANIFITNDGIVKILDFGLAKLSGQTQLTKEGSTLGTVAYMSPEQARGETIDARSDIWSLGVVFYEMLSGQPPFKGEYEQAVIYSILNEEPDDLSELKIDFPNNLSIIITKLLSKEKQNRYSAITDFFNDLKRFRAGEDAAIIKFGSIHFFRMRKWLLRKSIFTKSVLLSCFIIVLATILIFIGKGTIFYPDGAISVAVLHLNKLGQEGDEWYSYGITQDIIIDLSKAGIIRIPSMNDILPFKDSEKSLSEIAEILQVRFILTGSLGIEKLDFKLAMQLIEAKSGDNVWADRWVAPLSELSSTTGKVIEEIITELGLNTPAEMIQHIKGRATTNVDAFDFYLRGKYRFDFMKSEEDIAIARGFFEKAIEMDSSFVSAMLYLGDIYFHTGDNDRALFYYNNSLLIAERQEALIDQALAMLSLGIVYRIRGEYEDALQMFNNSLSISQGLGDISSEAINLRNIGVIYDEQGDYDNAMDYFKRALSISRMIKSQRMEGRNLNSIGNVYYNQQKYNEALDYFEQSSAVKHESKDYRGEADALGNIGIIYYTRGAYDEALNIFLQSLEISEGIGYRSGIAYALDHLGNCYYTMGDLNKALEFLSRSLVIIREIEDRLFEGYSLFNIGNTYRELGDIKNAGDHLTQSLTIFEELESDYMKGMAFTGLGMINYTNKDYKSAVGFLNKSIKTFELVQSELDIIKSLSYLVLCREKMGGYDLMREDAQNLKSRINLDDLANIEYDVLWNISQIHRLLGNSNDAELYLDKAYEKIMDTLNKIKDEEKRQEYLASFKIMVEVITAWEEMNK